MRAAARRLWRRVRPPTGPCGVCEERTPKDALQRTACGHEACAPCFRAWISVELDGTAPRPRCFAAGCLRPLDDADLRRIATPTQLWRFEDRVLRTALRTWPDFEFCPSAGCRGGGVVPPAGSCRRGPRAAWLWALALAAAAVALATAARPLALAALPSLLWAAASAGPRTAVQCAACGHWWTPARLRRRGPAALAQDALSEAWKHVFAARCAQCGVATWRYAGCDHVTCLSCGGEYCYVCGAPWEGHTPCATRGGGVGAGALLRAVVVPLALALRLHVLLVLLVAMAAGPLRRPWLAGGLVGAGVLLVSRGG